MITKIQGQFHVLKIGHTNVFGVLKQGKHDIYVFVFYFYIKDIEEFNIKYDKVEYHSEKLRGV